MSDSQQAPLPPQQQSQQSYGPRMFDESEYQRRQDEDQLRLLAIFHYVMGGLMGLTALYPLIYVGLGIMMVCMPASQQPKNDIGPAFMGVPFIVIGSLATAMCAAIAGFTIKAGVDLNARRGLTFIQVMACIGCLYMPFGTILGVFTLIVVSRPSVRALFDRLNNSQRFGDTPEIDRPSALDR